MPPRLAAAADGDASCASSLLGSITPDSTVSFHSEGARTTHTALLPCGMSSSPIHLVVRCGSFGVPRLPPRIWGSAHAPQRLRTFSRVRTPAPTGQTGPQSLSWSYVCHRDRRELWPICFLMSTGASFVLATVERGSRGDCRHTICVEFVSCQFWDLDVGEGGGMDGRGVCM